MNQQARNLTDSRLGSFTSLEGSCKCQLERAFNSMHFKRLYQSIASFHFHHPQPPILKIQKIRPLVTPRLNLALVQSMHPVVTLAATALTALVTRDVLYDRVIEQKHD